MASAPVNISLSLIIPLYNRPDEIDELLQSLTGQSDGDFEVMIVEDGSDVPAKSVIRTYSDRLRLTYLTKENGGPGPARNYGAARAGGSYFIFLDSDCILPEGYIAAVRQGLLNRYTDAFGGPDRAHPSFTPLQQAINYAMTSPLTTGGIRGGKQSLEKFHPRSFNMGISRTAFGALDGFAPMRFGEDVDFSIRLMRAGYSTQLLPDAWVYHKRRTDLRKFFRQVHNSGIARIELTKRHPGSLRAVHLLPALFTLGMAASLVLALFWRLAALIPFALYFAAVLADASLRTRSAAIGLRSVAAVAIQLTGYGSGFIRAFWRRIILRKGSFQAFERTFYK